MRRHSHHRRPQNARDCSNVTPQMHTALGQPSSVQGISFSSLVLGLVQASVGSTAIEALGTMIACQSHDPPASSLAPVLSLRI
jgi:hypothetical protein